MVFEGPQLQLQVTCFIKTYPIYSIMRTVEN